MAFKDFGKAVRDQFNKMAVNDLYVVEIGKDEIWDTYMNAFPAGTNELYRERREYDCNYCKQFIRRVGNVVAIIDNKLVSIWDVTVNAEEEYYQVVADKMAEAVKSAPIRTKFLYNEKNISVESNHGIDEATGHTQTWHHFSCVLPQRFVSHDVGSVLSDINATKAVYERGLKELTPEAIDITLDLIHQNSLYKGEEFRDGVASFGELKAGYDALETDIEKSIYVWSTMNKQGARIRNTAIGTLLQDISEGVDLTRAVASFETKVAPANYKRTSAPITKGMVKQAMTTINELGIEESLKRRYAIISDISVNNVLFVDRNVAPMMQDSLEDMLMGEVKVSKKTFDDVEEISISDFVENVLPKAEALEVYVKNSHQTNFMSLVAPENEDAPNIFQWNNNYSWGYNGNLTDSAMKERVKNAGGNVDGVFRYSIQWNDKRDNNNDLDAHLLEPNGNTIFFQRMRSNTSGTLDVDITNPNSQRPHDASVENIIYTDINRMPEGIYTCMVHNYAERGGRNFSAEIEFEGRIFTFAYEGKFRQSEKIIVAKVKYTKANGFEIIESLPHSETSQDIWGVPTERFVKVSSMMLSPNHWDEQAVGNRHFFFILDGCLNPEKTRGFYNEFLDHSLTKHRKVFEVLADKMKCDESDNQLSGLGFSSTKRNELICKVSGSFTRTLKIKF